MPKCFYHTICGLDAVDTLEGRGMPTCILHSPEVTKDHTVFDKALKAHIAAERKRGQYEFNMFHFPEGFCNFSNIDFDADVHLNGATFHGDAKFEETRFRSSVDFTLVTFRGSAIFVRTKFDGQVHGDGPK